MLRPFGASMGQPSGKPGSLMVVSGTAGPQAEKFFALTVAGAAISAMMTNGRRNRASRVVFGTDIRSPSSFNAWDAEAPSLIWGPKSPRTFKNWARPRAAPRDAFRSRRPGSGPAGRRDGFRSRRPRSAPAPG